MKKNSIMKIDQKINYMKKNNKKNKYDITFMYVLYILCDNEISSSPLISRNSETHCAPSIGTIFLLARDEDDTNEPKNDVTTFFR